MVDVFINPQHYILGSYLLAIGNLKTWLLGERRNAVLPGKEIYTMDQNLIDQIRRANDIVDVIQGYIPLKR